MIAKNKRDARGGGLIFLACFLLLLSLNSSVGTLTVNRAGGLPNAAELDLFWSGAVPGLIADQGNPPVSPGKTPASLAPLLLQKIPVNRAGSEILESIPGIGSELAQRIIKERDHNGQFLTAQDLSRVPGIGKIRQERLTEYLRFD